MGMAASQARFLGLTARLSNNEYQAQQINQQRLNLAENQTAITKNYQDKLNNRMFKLNLTGDTSVENKQLSYWDIVGPEYTKDENGNYFKTALGYRIVDTNGNVIVPNYPGNTSDTEIGAIVDKYKVNEDVLDKDKLYSNIISGDWEMKAKRTDDEGNEYWITIPFDEATFISKMRAENPNDSSDTEYYRLYNTLLSKVDGNYQELTYENLTTMDDLEIRLYEKDEDGDNAKILVPEIPDDDQIIIFDKYKVDKYCVDNKYLEEKLRSGEWILQQPTPITSAEDGWANLAWQGCEFIEDDYDTTDDAAAEAEYEYLISKFQKQDKMLELRLKQLETEHQAISNELDAVSKVLEKNIDSSFKTFA